MFKNGKRLYAGFLCGIAALFCGINGSIEVQAAQNNEIVLEKMVIHEHDPKGSGICYEPIYHEHTGSSTSGGGCYSVLSQSKSNCGRDFGGRLHYIGYDNGQCYKCSYCGHTFRFQNTDDRSYEGTSCTNTIFGSFYYDLGCGKTPSSIDDWNLVCEKEELFTITIVKSIDENGYVLSPSIDILDNDTEIVNVSWNKGNSEDLIITDNGNYVLTITYTDNEKEKTETFEYAVEDFFLNIEGNITWQDGSNKFNTRPDSVNVILMRDGKEADRIEGLTSNNLNKWAYESLYRYSLDDGHMYSYEILLEGAVSKTAPEDKYVITQADYDFVCKLTNAYDPDNLDENDKGKGYYYSGNIYWQDKNDNLGYRPKNVTINFYREGNGNRELYKTASVDAFQQNYYEFTRLPKYYYDADGELYKYIYSVEEVFGARYVTTDYEVKAAYTIFPDTPQDFSFTNKFTAAGNVTGMKPDKEDDDSINIKTDTDDKIAINLKQMECVITADGEIIFGDNYSGIEYNIVADKNGVRIDLPDGKYEINILDNRYSANDIIVVDTDNLKIVEENGKHYLIVGNTDRPDNNADKEAPDIKIESEEKITVNLKQMEYIVNEDNSITFGDNYSGVEYNITVDKDGTPINIPDGKYEINISDDRYMPEDIIILDTDRIQIIEENGKWYMIVGDMNQNETEPDIKIETDDKISINLKQMEFIVNEDGSISYGNNYSGLEFNITVDKNGTPINIPDGKYEINIPDGRYSPEDIIVLNNNKVTIVQEGDKWYMIVGDNNGNGNDGNGGITITTDKKENYEHRDSRSNFFSVTMIYT